MKFLKKMTTLTLIGLSLCCVNAYADELVPSNCPPPEEITAIPDSSVLIEPQTAIVRRARAKTEYPIDENGHTQQIKTSNNPDNNYTLTVSDDSLLIQGFCSDDTKKFFWPHLKLNGKNKLEQLLIEKDTSGSVEINGDISALEDGVYEFQLFAASKMFGESYKYVVGGIKLTIENGEKYFTIPYIVYKNNQDFMFKNYRAPEYYLDQEFVKAWLYTNENTKKWAEEITKGCVTDYEKIKAVHNWVADNIFYDYEYLEGRKSTTNLSPEDVYNNKITVCQGYADLSASLLRSIGIPCKVAEGYAGSGGEDFSRSPNHAWNEAWCSEEQRWIIFDATWDSGNKYDYEDSNEMVKGNFGLTFFDPIDYVFAENHRIDDYARYKVENLADINSDGEHTNVDTAMLMKMISDIDKTKDIDKLDLVRVDVNGDKKRDFLDVIASLKKLAFDKLV